MACDIDDDAGNDVVAQIEADGGSATFVSADVAVAEDRRRLIDAVETGWSGIDILVNNASADPGELGPFEAWPRTLGVDLFGPAQLTLEAVESMRRRGSHGAIVNIGSLSALPHSKEHSPWPGYDMAKAGMMRLTTALEFLGSEGIRVNCLLPGWVSSPPVATFVETLTKAQQKERGVPAQLLAPDEVAEMVLRLVTDESLHGRIVLMRNGEPAVLIAADDPGYASVEPLPDEEAGDGDVEAGEAGAKSE
jgi:NAD(P)-dependent dehydrogenase (short-subunit alcohol dehydrogenase family)